MPCPRALHKAKVILLRKFSWTVSMHLTSMPGNTTTAEPILASDALFAKATLMPYIKVDVGYFEVVACSLLIAFTAGEEGTNTF